MKAIKVKDICVGEEYTLKGNIQNGNFVTRENVTRKVVRITDKHIVCECGRRFIIDKDLVVTK